MLLDVGIEKDVGARRKELQETGCLPDAHMNHYNHIFDNSSALFESKVAPVLLLDQQLVKKSGAHDYNFVKTITEDERDVRGRKHKHRK